jgi:hypothetical protein
MLLLLGSLILIYLRLNIALGELKRKEKIIVWVPFSLYLGWINIATIANTTVFLVSINWDGFGIAPIVWANIIIIVAVILTLIIFYTRQDFILPLVTIWALFGIAARRFGEYYQLALLAIIMMIVVGINLLFVFIRKNYRTK